LDILNLRDWYRTPTGHVVRRQIQSALQDMWPDIQGKRILVLGFGTPYIKLWLKEAQVFCAMPASMGGVCWPDRQPNRATLVTEEYLPFMDCFFDAILLVHSLEFCKDETALMWECNRVLKDCGRLLAIVPNRAGAWSHREISPLARGLPFSQGQLMRAFKESAFLPVQNNYALYVPPTDREWVHKYSQTFERLGRKWRAPMGGVILMEGKKDMHAGVVVRTNSLLNKRMVLRPATA
jgi:SAM-dependent methyltransferase